MEASLLLAFTGFAAAMVALPGPDWALVLSAGTRAHGSAVPATVLGLAAGYALLTGAVAAGLAPLVTTSPTALTVMSLLGATYLLYLGASILLAPPAPTPGYDAVPAPRRSDTVLRGLGVGALNPKALLFFVAFLPQFARPEQPWPIIVQLVVFGGIWVLLVIVFYTFLGYAAAGILTRRPSAAHAISRITGAAMVVFGVILIVEQLIH